MSGVNKLSGKKLEEALKAEFRYAGLRWCKTYKELNDKRRREILNNMRQRREKNQAIEQEINARRAAAEPEDEPLTGSIGNVVGPLGHDCGGGRRNIRSTRGLS